MHKYHLIDLLAYVKVYFAQKRAQKLENYKYTFNIPQFLYKNGLVYCNYPDLYRTLFITPIVKNTQLLTYTIS